MFAGLVTSARHPTIAAAGTLGLGRIRARLLLIASTDAGKRKVDEAYRSRIGDNATFWYVPDAGHTKALSAHPGAYAARVSAFLATALATR